MQKAFSKEVSGSILKIDNLIKKCSAFQKQFCMSLTINYGSQVFIISKNDEKKLEEAKLNKESLESYLYDAFIQMSEKFQA